MREFITTSSHDPQSTTLSVPVTLEGHISHSCLQLRFWHNLQVEAIRDTTDIFYLVIFMVGGSASFMNSKKQNLASN